MTQNRLEYVLDCISTPSAAALCAAAVGDGGGKYSALGPIMGFPRGDVAVFPSKGYSVLGEMYIMRGHEFPAVPEDYEYGVWFRKIVQGLLDEGKIVPHPCDVKEGSLNGVLAGLDELRQGIVSGKKLVYEIL